MRILVAIPHYFHPTVDKAGAARHGSLGRDPAPRIEALTACIAALHHQFGGPQVIIDIANHRGRPANARLAPSRLDVIVCTTRGRHLLPRIPLPKEAFRQHVAEVDPPFLGFACQAALYERLGDYDYYCYLEDDLVIRDPWFFAKLGWFHRLAGPKALLMPNRYEVARGAAATKAYVDGEIRPGATAGFQDISVEPSIRGDFLGLDLEFRRSTNPHSGCFFLDSDQFQAWSTRPDFLEHDARFIGPLESAATLGPMRTFRVYKSAPESAGFLEIEHAGTAFIGLLRPSGRATSPEEIPLFG
jgi:hypothetical protein